MKKRKGKNKILKITPIIIFIIIFIIVVTIFTNKTVKNIEKQSENSVTQDSQYVKQSRIYPMKNNYFFQSYTGEVPEDKVIEKITNFIYYIIDNKSKFSQAQADKEYEENKDNLKEIGILSQEDYENIVKKLTSITNVNNTEFSYVEFDVKSFKIIDDVSIVNLNIKFTGIDEIVIEMELNNKYDAKDENFIKFK